MNKVSIKARNVLLLSEVDRVCGKIYGKNIQIVLLKGTALLKEEIFEIGEREMSDVDILVKPEDLKGFEKILSELGFKPMENSSSSFIRKMPAGVPPLIIDIHITLRHLTDIKDFWREGIKPCTKNKNIFVPKDDEMLLHLIAHPFLHHGVFSEKNRKDVKQVLIKKKLFKENFWRSLSEKARERKLCFMTVAVLTALEKEMPQLSSCLSFFKPKFSETILLPFIKTALRKHFNLTEYAIPLFYNPKKTLKYLWLPDEPMERRYGKKDIKTRLNRLLQILKNIFSRRRGNF